jgi:hypothetical protein
MTVRVTGGCGCIIALIGLSLMVIGLVAVVQAIL